jgi:hypothetical protein
MLAIGCASNTAVPVASATPAASVAPSPALEVRHMYLFEPGKKPVLIVHRENGSPSAQEVSAEPPEVR